MQVHALETAAIKPEPFNQYVSAGVVSGVATVSIGNVAPLVGSCDCVRCAVQEPCSASPPSCCPS